MVSVRKQLLILVLLAPLVLWSVTLSVLYVMRFVLPIEIGGYGRLPSGVFKWLFLWCISAPGMVIIYYRYIHRSNPKALRLWNFLALFYLLVIFIFITLDKIIQSIESASWLLDGWLTLSVMVGVGVYMFVSHWMVRLLEEGWS